MARIWGRNTSANVQKAMWAAGEIGLRVERIDIGGPFGGNREAAYLALNPNGLIPTLEEDDGFVMWESNAIVRYLAERHGAGIHPPDLRARAVADQWMDWELSVLSPAMFPVFWGLVRTKPEDRNEQAIAAGIEKATAALRVLDDRLAESAFVAGDAFSVGDIPPAVHIRRFLELVADRPPLPNVERWYAAIAERPAFQTHVTAIALT
ncbi:glutathione S-transferase family protein [Amorphus orientalis]|uniref:Glutathione S-transferase n=1 Tax=Amorphus orientalis TaxID=649198 RepID=A0AAE3VMA0_9HYPH|nr:glutathione S-transferase family protein [Amorphus orientalis]MDQ0314350.1 glutathione S-transferase [Amorphus orientalis]